MSDFEGVLPILSVPFEESGEIDYKSVRTQIGALADGGCHGVILFGFGSEFYKLSEAERHELTQVSIEAGEEHGIPVHASLTEQTTVTAVEWAEWFEDEGVDGLMMLPPYMSGPSEEELLEHIGTVGEAVSLPIMVQYAPQNVGVTISPDTFAELSDRIANLSDYKIECQPPGPYMTALLEKTDNKVDILVGSAGQQFIEALDRGAVGVIPSGGLHELYIRVYRHYVEGDREAAIEAHNKLLPFLNHQQGGESFVHYDKQIQAARGFIDEESAHVRSPTAEPDEHQQRLFEDHFETLRQHLDDR